MAGGALRTAGLIPKLRKRLRRDILPLVLRQRSELLQHGIPFRTAPEPEALAPFLRRRQPEAEVFQLESGIERSEGWKHFLRRHDRRSQHIHAALALEMGERGKQFRSLEHDVAILGERFACWLCAIKQLREIN